jgi:SAM-dependent methyltransferase
VNVLVARLEEGKMGIARDDGNLKEDVRRHWDAQPCGTRDIPEDDRARFFSDLERERYEWEPYIPPVARFARGRWRDVLELGVGAGTDFVNWVRQGARATGVDLTTRGVELTRERLALEGLHADVRIADGERLPFADESFDIVYSYGVLHHSPDTASAIREVRRVLRPGGNGARYDLPRSVVGRSHALGPALRREAAPVAVAAVGDLYLSRKPWNKGIHQA